MKEVADIEADAQAVEAEAEGETSEEPVATAEDKVNPFFSSFQVNAVE